MNLSVMGADDAGESALTYTWATTGTPPAAVTFSANASNAAKATVASFSAAGTYSFAVTLKDAGKLTASSQLSLTVSPTLTSLNVLPASVNVSANGTQQFSATGKDQFGTPLATPSNLAWAASGGSISSSGNFVAPGSASAPITITAKSGSSLSASATVTVGTITPIAGCSATPGTWQNITPPQLNSALWCSPAWADQSPNPPVPNLGCYQPGRTNPITGQLATYGANAFVVDPVNHGTVYLGTSSMGMWKTTNCGSTWSPLTTGPSAGKNADAITRGRNWTMVIDPSDPQVLYTVAGYADGGIFKSSNGGVDWAQILPANIMSATGNGFMEKITLDLSDPKHKHLLASFHTPCTGTPLPGAPVASDGTWACLAESTDAGVTWSLTTNAFPWNGTDGPGQTMVDAKTWFYGTNGPNGLWRTTTGGVSANGAPAWKLVQPGNANGSVYVARDGSFYAGGGNGNVIHSVDGITWSTIPNSAVGGSLNGSTPMVDTGAILFTTTNGTGTQNPYWSAPTKTYPNPAAPFTQMSTPSMVAGGAYMDYDPAFGIVYSSNMLGGFWRYIPK
ncbi:MAG: hypothetical protein ABI605_23150 [Rhizobacter sp.]